MVVPGASWCSPGASNLSRGRSVSAGGVVVSVISVIFLFLLAATSVPAVHADASLVALTLPESNTTSGYFPLSKALRSVMRLAVEDINGGALATTLPDDASTASSLDGNLTLSVVEVATGSRAIEGLCDALEYVGENGTFGVGAKAQKSRSLPYTWYLCAPRSSCQHQLLMVDTSLLLPVHIRSTGDFEELRLNLFWRWACVCASIHRFARKPRKPVAFGPSTSIPRSFSEI